MPWTSILSKSILDNFSDVSAEKNIYFQNNNSSFEEQMMLADFESYMTDDIFCKVDRASMYYSLETRAPYLNTDLIEFMEVNTNLSCFFEAANTRQLFLVEPFLNLMDNLFSSSVLVFNH